MTEWHASDYHKQSTLQQTMAEEQLALLTLKGNERILDVGCGDGRITAEIAARVPLGSVLGVDPSHDMIAFASSHIPPNQTNLRFEIGDVRQLPYENEFDLVVSFNALHWVPEQEAALASIHESLKHNAQFLGRFVPEGDRKCLEDVMEDVRHRPRWAEYFVSFRKPYIHFTAQEYRTLAERCGFQVVRLHVEDKAWDFKTREMFVAFARATFVEWTRYLPEREWDAFIADVLDSYQLLAADKPSEVNTFKFYQMDVVLRSMDH